MMEYLELNGISYGFTRDFKHNPYIRKSFNKLTYSAFGFSLENWYRKGLWREYYVTYSLLHNNEVVSNVSINKIELDIENKSRTGIQIGTVMTDEKYRHRGLNSFIIEQVMNEWKDRADLIYLFANDSVLDFYSKFDFKVVEEYQCYKSVNTDHSLSPLKRLNVEDKADEALLIETVKKSIPIAKVSMRNNPSLIMFHCTSYKKNSIFYNEDLKAIAIADFEGDTLYLNDVFAEKHFELNDLIQVMSHEKIRKVVLGFTPLNETGFDKRLLKGGDTLFMLKGKVNYFEDNQWMFPVLSHA